MIRNGGFMPCNSFVPDPDPIRELREEVSSMRSEIRQHNKEKPEKPSELKK